jgi:hypothetical protein
MAVAPPFANLLCGMTTFRVKNKVSLLPVQKGQTGFENKYRLNRWRAKPPDLVLVIGSNTSADLVATFVATD